MERLGKRKWEVRVKKYISLIEISDSNAIKAILTQVGDKETYFRFVLAVVLRSTFFILVSSNFAKDTNDSEKKFTFPFRCR